MLKKKQHKSSSKTICILLCAGMLFLVLSLMIKKESEIVETIVLDAENTCEEEKELENKKLLVEQWNADKENANALSLLEDKASAIKVKSTGSENTANTENTENTENTVNTDQEKLVKIESVNEAQVAVNTEIAQEAVEQEIVNQQVEQSTDVSLNETMQVSESDYDVLVRIVEAEATGEDIKGKILVANVILNRVNHDSFPDTVYDVVFETCGGSPQFSPTADGRFDSVEISDESREAVERALDGEDYSNGALYFSARSQADPDNMNWFDSKLKWLFKYGGHEFYALKE